MIPTPGPISKPCALRHGINSEIRPKRQSPNRGSVRAQKARPSGAKKHNYAVLAIEAQHLSGGQAATASRPLSPLLHVTAACRPLQSLLTQLQPSAQTPGSLLELTGSFVFRLLQLAGECSRPDVRHTDGPHCALGLLPLRGLMARYRSCGLRHGRSHLTQLRPHGSLA